MDKVERRALGFAVWVILALILTLLLDSYIPRLRGLGAALCLPLMVPIVLWNGGNGRDEPQMVTIYSLVNILLWTGIWAVNHFHGPTWLGWALIFTGLVLTLARGAKESGWFK